MTAVWTAMLIFVCVSLFLRAPHVLSTVQEVEGQLAPVTEILAITASADVQTPLSDEQLLRLRQALQQLALGRTELGSGPAIERVQRFGAAWLAQPSHMPEELPSAAFALAVDGQQHIATIRSRDNEAYFTVFLAALGLILSLFLVRHLVVKLVAPLEELYHYFDQMDFAVSMHLFSPLPAVQELETIENALNALVQARLSYVDARHYGVPFDDQAAADAMLERIEAPVWVIGRRGALLGANDAAIDLLAGPDGVRIRGELKDLTPLFVSNVDNAEDEDLVVPPGWELEIAGDGEAMICILRKATEES